MNVQTTLIVLNTLGILVILVSAKRIPNFAGPYRVVLRRMTNVSEDFTSTGDIWVQVASTFYKPGRPQYVWGESFSSIDIDDGLRADVHIARWSGNQWKKNAFVLKFERGCTDALFHAKVLMVMFFDEDGKNCPIKMGRRTITNHTSDLVFPQFPIFPYGRWLFTLAVYKEKQVIGLFAGDWETVPRL